MKKDGTYLVYGQLNGLNLSRIFENPRVRRHNSVPQIPGICGRNLAPYNLKLAPLTDSGALLDTTLSQIFPVSGTPKISEKGKYSPIVSTVLRGSSRERILSSTCPQFGLRWVTGFGSEIQFQAANSLISKLQLSFKQSDLPFLFSRQGTQ